MKKKLAIVLLFAIVIPSIVIAFTVSATTNVYVKDGSFESANGTWNDGRNKTDSAFIGNWVIQSKNGNEVKSKEIDVSSEKFKKVHYLLSFWYVNNSEKEANLTILKASDLAEVKKQKLSPVNDWSRAEVEFEAGQDCQKITLALKGENVMIDALNIDIKSNGSDVPLNGSFEKGLSKWKIVGSKPKLSDLASDGIMSLALSDASDSCVYADISVDKGTDYILNFDYKGIGSADSCWAVRTTDGTDSNSGIVQKGYFENKNSWQTVSQEFNSGSSSTLRIVFSGGKGSGITIDNVSVNPAESTNLIKNSGFEEDFTIGWESANRGDLRSDKPERVKNGKYALDLSKTWSHMRVKQQFSVKPNTEYLFSYWVRNDSAWISCRIAKEAFATGGPVETYFPITNGEWQLVKQTFNSGDNEKLWLSFNTGSDNPIIFIDDVTVTEVVAEDSIIKNGSFESGTSNWKSTKSWIAFDTSEESHSGNYSLDFNNKDDYAGLYQDFSVKKNCDYFVAFYVKGKAEYWSWGINPTDNRVEPSSGGLVYCQYPQMNHEDWTLIFARFNTGENETLRFTTKIGTSKARQLYLDDVKVFESTTGLIANGDFEASDFGWSSDNTVSITNIENSTLNGTNSLNLKGINHQRVYQELTVEKNKNYKFSFKYKGKPPKYASTWGILSEAYDYETGNVLNKGILPETTEWTDYSVVVKSEDNTKLYLTFQGAADSDFYIDDVIVSETNESVSPIISAGSLPSDFLHPKKVNYTVSNEKNLISDNSFESEGNWNTPTFINGVLSVVNQPALAHTGSKALKFSANRLEEKSVSVLNVPVEPNTEYAVYFWVKGEYYSLPDNTNDMVFGISVPDSKTLLTEIYPASWDNEWHLVGKTFNSNSATAITLSVSGKNSVAYIDDIYVMKLNDADEYLGEARKLKTAELTDSNPKLLGCEDNDNLIKNFDLNSKDNNKNGFWSSGQVFGRIVNIDDSKNSVYGNALHYTDSHDSFYGNKTYYMKWIEVKPNTYYTFSSKYCIVRMSDEGFFTILDGNNYMPSRIMEFSYGDDKYDRDCNWQTAACTIYTNESTKIGIGIYDGGGEAYIDDLRFFETSKGKKLAERADNFPKSYTSNKYTIAAGYISNIPLGTTVGSIKNTLSNKKYIRIFDSDGNEVTDMNTPVTTSTEFRLMDGPTVKYRTTALVAGDVNGDGKINKKDTEAIRRHIVGIKPLSGAPAIVADADRDGRIRIKDAVYISMYLSGKSNMPEIIYK